MSDRITIEDIDRRDTERRCSELRSEMYKALSDVGNGIKRLSGLLNEALTEQALDYNMSDVEDKTEEMRNLSIFLKREFDKVERKVMDFHKEYKKCEEREKNRIIAVGNLNDMLLDIVDVLTDKENPNLNNIYLKLEILDNFVKKNRVKREEKNKLNTFLAVIGITIENNFPNGDRALKLLRDTERHLNAKNNIER